MAEELGFGEIRMVFTLEVNPSIEGVIRLLGRRARVRPKPSLESRIQEMRFKAEALAVPQALFGLWRDDGPPDLTPPWKGRGEAALTAVGAVTIGDELEEEVRRMSGSGELADATILDAWGSELAEAAAGALDEYICGEIGPLGLRPGRRKSPGYGAWKIEEQRPLLSRLRAERIGIRLSEGHLMIPRKSVSFAKPFGGAPESETEPGSGDPCPSCGLDDCLHRRDKELG
jgi:hypothetical protein